MSNIESEGLLLEQATTTSGGGGRGNANGGNNGKGGGGDDESDWGEENDGLNEDSQFVWIRNGQDGLKWLVSDPNELRVFV